MRRTARVPRGSASAPAEAPGGSGPGSPFRRCLPSPSPPRAHCYTRRPRFRAETPAPAPRGLPGGGHGSGRAPAPAPAPGVDWGRTESPRRETARWENRRPGSWGRRGLGPAWCFASPPPLRGGPWRPSLQMSPPRPATPSPPLDAAARRPAPASSPPPRVPCLPGAGHALGRRAAVRGRGTRVAGAPTVTSPLKGPRARGLAASGLPGLRGLFLPGRAACAQAAGAAAHLGVRPRAPRAAPPGTALEARAPTPWPRQAPSPPRRSRLPAPPPTHSQSSPPAPAPCECPVPTPRSADPPRHRARTAPARPTLAPRAPRHAPAPARGAGRPHPQLPGRPSGNLAPPAHKATSSRPPARPPRRWVLTSARAHSGARALEL